MLMCLILRRCLFIVFSVTKWGCKCKWVSSVLHSGSRIFTIFLLRKLGINFLKKQSNDFLIVSSFLSLYNDFLLKGVEENQQNEKKKLKQYCKIRPHLLSPNIVSLSRHNINATDYFALI